MNEKENSTLQKTKYQIKLTEKSNISNSEFNQSKPDHRFVKLKTMGPSKLK